MPTMLRAAEELGLEGVVAKRADSPYRPGERSDAWRKVKVTAGQELVVGGWLPGKGRLDRPPRVAARRLPRDARRAAALRGTGRLRHHRCDPRRPRVGAHRRADARTAPFVDPPRLPDPVWVEPDLVVDVAFHQWTEAGTLRAPRFRGRRDDKDAATVVREDR